MVDKIGLPAVLYVREPMDGGKCVETPGAFAYMHRVHYCQTCGSLSKLSYLQRDKLTLVIRIELKF